MSTVRHDVAQTIHKQKEFTNASKRFITFLEFGYNSNKEGVSKYTHAKLSLMTVITRGDTVPLISIAITIEVH